MILGQGEENRPKYVHCIKSENINEKDPIYKSVTEVSAFWNTIIKEAGEFPRRLDEHRLKLWERLRDAWSRLQPKLPMDPGSSPLLLMMWDEAKALVSSRLDPTEDFSENNDDDKGDRITRFRLQRRAYSEIGQLNTPEDVRVRMFALLTDTSSHITNFQPSSARESNSFRRIAIKSHGIARFEPIYLIPTMNYAACAFLDLSLDDVDQPQRLIMFGRTAWSATARGSVDFIEIGDYSKLPKDTIASAFELARAKLFRKAGLVKSLFDPSSERNVIQEMVACLGPRLQLHSGSNVSAISDLVAGHLMVLIRVDEDHTDLEAMYPSESILAAVSAEATGTYGWHVPLEKLNYMLSHGIVDKGYRGELIARILCLIASEDSVRPAPNEDVIHQASNKGNWPYTSQTTVSKFLNHFFCEPTVESISSKSDAPMTSMIESIPSKSDTPMPSTSTAPIIRMQKRTANSPLLPKRSPKRRRSKNFDDWPSDEEDKFHPIKSNDGIPPQPTRDHWTAPIIMSGIFGTNFGSQIITRSIRKKINHPNQTMTRMKEISKFLEGRVFFNHFITLHTIMRPSILLKAFNCGAAIMTKSNTHGVDFIIPVILPSADEKILSRLGNLFGEWTDEQERAAAEIVSFIMIDVKDKSSMTRNAAKTAVMKVIPKEENFMFYKPQNFYMSVIISCGAPGDKMLDNTGVQIHRQFGRSAILEKQIPITALGIDPTTFQCLISRSHVTKSLRDLRVGARNPVRGLHKGAAQKARARLVREVYLFGLHPERQEQMADYAKMCRRKRQSSIANLGG